MTTTNTAPIGANDDARQLARIAAEKIILGLQLASAPGAAAIVRDELGEDWRRFVPLHARILQEIAADHAKHRIIRTVEIMERARPALTDARFNFRAYVQTLAASWTSDADAARQMREAIRAWRVAMGDANAAAEPPPTDEEKMIPDVPAPGNSEAPQPADESLVTPVPAVQDAVGPRVLQKIRDAKDRATLRETSALLNLLTRQHDETSERRVFLRRASLVKPEPVRWLWEGWLAQGKLHLLAGHAGTGKTTLALALAATLSRGGLFPDGSRAPTGATILWSGEDDLADSLLPRFLACGGDPRLLLDCSMAENARGTRHGFDPAEDFPSLVDVAKQFGNVKLVIVDPIVSAAGAGINNAQTRKALRPLVDFAEATGAAILGITHFAKASAGRNLGERVIGSGAFHAMARAVWTTAMPADIDMPFRLVRAKSNIGPARDGFEYRLARQTIGNGETLAAQTIAWGEPLFGSPRALLAEIERPEAEVTSVLARAKVWLAERLKDGPVAARTITAEARERGFGLRTLERAKRELRIGSHKNERDSGWSWTSVKTANEGGSETFGGLDGLELDGREGPATP